MTMRRFNFAVAIAGEDVAHGVIDVDQKVFDEANSAEFKEMFYTFSDDADIAAHVAKRMVIAKEKLSDIEGFMLPDDLAKIVEYPHGYDDYDFYAKEVVKE